MPETYFVRKGKKMYAYTSTSVYEPGKKHPRTVTEYIGVLDESTGTIIPKKSKKSPENLLDEDGIKGRRFGGSYLFHHISEQIGLREDLFGTFGFDGEKILACAVAQALSGGAMSSVEDTMEGCMVRQLQGLGSVFSSQRMSEFTNSLGTQYDALESLFEKRLKRADSTISFDLTSASTYGHMREWGEWGHNRDKEKLRQVNIGLITDSKGVPLMFEMYPGSVSDIRTLERTVDRVEGLKGSACTLVMDRGFGSASNLKYMLDSEMSFVIPGKRGTKCVKALMSQLVKEKENPDIMRIHDKATYSVLERTVAIVPRKPANEEDEDSNDTVDLELVLEDDPRFRDAPESMRMVAHVCFDARKAAEDRNDVQIALDSIEKRLRGMQPYEALNGLKKVAGGYAKYFDLQVVEGELKLERKRNALSFSMNREGMFVMFSHGIETWEDMMSCYDSRVYVEQAFDVFKNELDGNRWRTGDPDTARGRLFIKFVALIIWCEISKRLREASSNEPVRTVIQSMDNILAIGIGDDWRILEITKRNRAFMETLEIPLPIQRMNLPVKQYIPKAIKRQILSDSE